MPICLQLCRYATMKVALLAKHVSGAFHANMPISNNQGSS